MYIDAATWGPVGVASLEDVALDVVRSDYNTLVVAGPGAGKTELLAQRAAYLLQTGSCKAPSRILAISFKRDAAKNLGERVQRRCGDIAIRFDSLTLDAFAKNIVDRFRAALPEAWRPKPQYEVRTRSLKGQEMRTWMDSLRLPPGSRKPPFHGYRAVEIFFDRCTHGHELPYAQEIRHIERVYGLQWWSQQLAAPSDRPSLTFPMLNRLAAYLLRMNPMLVRAVRLTYRYVFMDEFQDTTAAQYDLIRMAFLGPSTVMTAVGDSKQRIMVWAGAKKDIFAAFETDFNARRRALIRNYRSAPQLVQMQGAIIDAIEAGTPRAESARKGDMKGVGGIVEFVDHQQEARVIAEAIAKGLHREGLKPRDFCVLARQRTGVMVEPLRLALLEHDIRLRDETELQDLLSEPVSTLLVNMLILSTRKREPGTWSALVSELSTLTGLTSENNARELQQFAARLLRFCKVEIFTGRNLSQDELTLALRRMVVEEIGAASLRSAYRQYARGRFLFDTVDRLSSILHSNLASCDSPAAAVDELIGLNTVPAMSIHKSKGLEFDTIFFVGLEDSSWWSFARESDEEKRSFFVAFSRAIRRVFFTYCDRRSDKKGASLPQQRQEIADLYAILKRAGVPTHNFRDR